MFQGAPRNMTEQQDRLLDRKDLRDRGIKFHRVHIDRLVKAGKFPRPIRVGANRLAWIESEISRWINERIAARDAA
jgi:prophage regulatory protein